MSNYQIMTDSCADLPLDIVESMHLTVLPLAVTIDHVTYRNYPDQRDITNHAFYDLLRDKKVARTSQINAEEFIEAALPLLQAGKDLLVIGFSSALSGTFNSMRLGALELKEKFPDRKIFVIDSLSASLGQGLLVYKALANQQNGMSIEENAQWVEENKLKVIHLFTVDDLGTLKRGGRLTATKAFLGTLLMLKPVLHVDPMGRLVPLGTKRGRKQAFLEIIRLMEEKMRDDEIIFISHGDTLNDALELQTRILELHPKNKVFLMNHVGPVIGSHSGPGTIALFFFGKDR